MARERRRRWMLGCAAVALAAGCAEQRRSLGEDCLKDDDCLSGICADNRCVAAPPLLDGSAGAGDASPDAPGIDAGPEAGIDGGKDAAPEAAPDAPADAGSG